MYRVSDSFRLGRCNVPGEFSSNLCRVGRGPVRAAGFFAVGCLHSSVGGILGSERLRVGTDNIRARFGLTV